MAATCYLSPGKRKAQKVCQAFAEGCGGRVVPAGPVVLGEGAAFFYGWTEHTARLISQCRREGSDWFYADNAYYFGRGTLFRVTKNALMHDGSGNAAPDRIRALQITIKPWRKDGVHIVLATQSELFYRLHLWTSRDAWTHSAVADVRRHTDRPVVVCHKPPTPWPNQWPHANFEDAIKGAWAVVSYSSSVMVKAIAEGVPVVSLGPSMASRMATALEEIEHPSLPLFAERQRWLSNLTANQWSLAAMREGQCWQDLQGIRSQSAHVL